jgi:hypothetical protein
MATMKENAIKDYMSNINFNDDKWSIDEMKKDMRKFLGEEPAIDVKYEKTAFVNEDSGTTHEGLKLEGISIIFYDTDEKFKKIDLSV